MTRLAGRALAVQNAAKRAAYRARYRCGCGHTLDVQGVPRHYYDRHGAQKWWCPGCHKMLPFP